MDLEGFNTIQVLHHLYNLDQLLIGKDYIRALVQRIGEELHVKYVMVGHAIEPEQTKVESDFMWADGQFVDNVIYDLEGTPCVHVLCGTRVNCYAQGVALAFPEDKMLTNMKIESYIGAPFLHTDGGLIGLLVIMDDKPLEEYETLQTVVEFCAARIGTEYRRIAFEESLRKVKENLEQQVQDRTKEYQLAFEKLQRTQRQMISQEKLATIGRITFGIAHELKNPLNVIINSAEIIQDLIHEDMCAESIEKLALMIHEHGDRANEIITSMLKQARQESEDTTESIDVPTLIDRSLEMCLRSLSDLSFKSDLKVEKDIGSNLKTLVVNPAGIERVFINLFDNALYAMSKKYHSEKAQGYKPIIKVALEKVEKNLKITIRDNGTGIPKKFLTNLFTEFFTTKPSGEGTGLGLYIARQTLQKSDGDISINSEDGQFTEIIIFLPHQELPSPTLNPTKDIATDKKRPTTNEAMP
ncbi:GAF domain-containing sensor histidine kinase [Bdellovibrio sp. NC01]|uniref:GAF domain-containing sensor histidine kinase n=1 Tax=Bdellovibrio sp. NC01 TaxID=2220073 RepID=UPI0011595CAB|nr:GAF domain-containing sensor histidine kinase [Bdellovibrio sp. NC01]QDK37875.1 hypothetical protein DOE51_09905 [Bdellovibrio sp. NC01]